MTEQELRDEFEKIKNDYGCIGLLNNEFKWFQKGYSLAQEIIAELESRLEQSVDISVVNELNETIKANDAEIEKLKSDYYYRQYLGSQTIKDENKRIYSLLEQKDKAIAEARFIIQNFLNFYNTSLEDKEKAKEWLRSNK